MNIKEVVIPAAGLGTRFLPYTKSIPKEMLPIINKPAIEYIVHEAIMSGLNEFFVITNKSKKAISNYFKNDNRLNKLINNKKKVNLLSDLDKIISSSIFSYINQEKQLGLGHAVLMAKEFIKNDFFGVMLPDDLFFSDQSFAINELMKIAYKNDCTVIGVQEVPKKKVSSYGIIEISEQISPNLYTVSNLIEKPKHKTSSNLAIVGRYVLSRQVFNSIEISTGSGGEIQLTDAILHMMKQGNKVLACKIRAIRYDIGTPLGWLKANFEIAKKVKYNNQFLK